MAAESDRQVHLALVPADGEPVQLIAFCGLVIRPGMADLVSGLVGMPCTACLARSPGSATGT